MQLRSGDSGPRLRERRASTRREVRDRGRMGEAYCGGAGGIGDGLAGGGIGDGPAGGCIG